MARLLDAQSSHDPLPSRRQVGTARWYQFLHQTASELSAVPAAELALQLFLTCAHSASGGQGGSRPGGGVQSGHRTPGTVEAATKNSPQTLNFAGKPVQRGGGKGG